MKFSVPVVCSHLREITYRGIFIQLSLTFRKVGPMQYWARSSTESRSEFFYISLEKRKNAISLEQYDRSQKNYVYDDTERVSRVHRPLKYLISKIQDGGGTICLRDLVCITRYRNFSTLRWRPSVILDIRKWNFLQPHTSNQIKFKSRSASWCQILWR